MPLSNYARLSPSLMMREIEEAHGSAIFDAFSILSPSRMARQIEDALGIEFTPLEQNSPSHMIAKIEETLDGAGDLPFLPDGYSFVTYNGQYVTHNGDYVIVETS